MKKKALKMAVSMLLAAELLFSSMPSALVSVAVDSPVQAGSEQPVEKNTSENDNLSDSEKEPSENLTEETPEKDDTEERQTPSNTTQNTKKTELKFYDNGETIEVSKVYDGSTTIEFVLDGNHLRTLNDLPVEQDLKAYCSLHFKNANVQEKKGYDESDKEDFVINNEKTIYPFQGEYADKYKPNSDFYKKLKQKVVASITELPLIVKIETDGVQNDENNPVTFYNGQSITIGEDTKTKYVFIGENRIIDENNSVKFRFDDEGKIEAYVEKANGKQNNNYTVSVEGNPKYELKQYVPQVDVGVNVDNNMSHLIPPANHLISADGKTFAKEIRFDNNTENYTVEYYLKNIDENSKYYNAVSDKMSYKYCDEIPEIGDISVELIKNLDDVREPSAVSVDNHKLLTGFNVKMTVPVDNYSNIPVDTNVALEIDGKKQTKTITAQDFANGRNSADFDIEVDAGKQKEIKFAVTLSNNLGNSEIVNNFRFVKDEIDNTYDILIIDKKPAAVSFKEPKKDSNYTEFKVQISDENGIAKVEYNWDDMVYSQEEKMWLEGEKSYVEYPIDVNGKYTFSLNDALVKNGDENIPLSKQQKKHTLYLKVTDQAGNVYEGDFTQKNAPDNILPEIYFADFVKGTTNVVDNVYKEKFGNFYNKVFTLRVRVKDQSEENSSASGVKSVELLTRDGNETKVYGNFGLSSELKEDGFKITFYRDTTEDGSKAATLFEDVKIRVTDNAKNVNIYKLSDLILEKSEEEKHEILSDDVLIENELPTVSAEFVNDQDIKELALDNNKLDYYGNDKNDGVIKFSFRDRNNQEENKNSGLKSIMITDSLGNFNKTLEFKEKKVLDTDCSIKVSEFESEGEHKLTITVTDNSGNKSTKTYTFVIDRTAPTGALEVGQPVSILDKDGKETLWFDENDNINIIVSRGDTNLHIAEIYVDGVIRTLTPSNPTTSSNSITIKQSEDENQHKHSHTISGMVYDKAGNSTKLEELILYRDFEEPEFDRVTVEMSNNDSALDQILNVLTFGIYSNTNVKIKAKVHDGEQDSGIDNVYIKFSNEETDESTEEADKFTFKDGEYYYEFNKLNGDDYVNFSKYFEITVKDKFGKETICQTISEATETFDIPEESEIPENSEVSEVSETTEVSEISEIPEVSEIPEMSEVSEVSSISADENKFFIMIENGKPVISDIVSDKTTNDKDGNKIEWYNDSNKITIGVSDAESGIGNIAVTDNDIEIYNESFYHTKEDIPDKIEFPIKDLSDGEHRFIVSVTDKSGNNTTKDEYVFYIDRTEPKVNVGESKIMSGEEDVAGKVTKTAFGNFYNNSITFQISVSDEETSATSGVKSVTMTADNLEDETQIPENGIVAFDLPLDNSKTYENICFTVADNAGNERKYGLKDIFGRYSMNSNDFLLEKESSNIEKSQVGNVGFGGKDFFGNDNKESQNIKFKFSDNHSGIKHIEIKDTVKDIAKNVVVSNETFVKQNFDHLSEKTMEYDFNKSVKELAEGEHTFEVSITDNSGNTNSMKYTFVVDYTRPTGSLNVTPEKIIDGKNWFDGKTVIKVGVDVTEVNIGTVVIKVNNETYATFNEGNFRQKVYIELDESKVKVNKEQKYLISGTITDKAGNTSDYSTVELQRDFEVPQINRVTVSNDGKSQLNVLPFGVYSNGTVTVTANVSDKNNGRNYESGIDHVNISYGRIKDVAMKGKNGIYVEIIAYDKFGKESAVCSQLFDKDEKNSTKEQNTDIMLETTKPTIEVDMPMDDDGGRASAYWYNPNKSNKDITFKIRDTSSGIRNIGVYVNGIEQKYDSRGNKFLIEDETGKAGKADTNEHTYYLNINRLAEDAKIPVSSDGKYTVKVTVTDNAGNEANNSCVFYVDKTTPKVDRFRFTAVDGDKNISNLIEELADVEYGFYFKQDFYVTVDLSDDNASSGLWKIQYNLISYKNGNKVGETGFTDGNLQDRSSAVFKVEKGFKGQIYVKVYDNVNNISKPVTPQAFVIDTEAVHGLETHIEMSHSSQTNKKDMSGNALYTNNETVKVVVTDTVSGIKNVSYSIQSENQNVALTNTPFNNTEYNVNDVIDGWRITKMDRNLITELIREFVFDSDNNDIILKVGMSDNATNESNLTASTFTVDKTAPKVEVNFDNNDNRNDGYYQAKRTATITITERNFDAKRIDARVNGSPVSFSFKSEGKVTHTAIYEFDEGDYSSFTVKGTDCSDRELSYNSNRFWIDLKDPQILPANEGDFKNDNGNLFKDDKTMRFTIIEHNFDEELVNVKVNGNNAEHKITDDGDTHILEIPFNKNGEYRATVQLTDKSGRVSTVYNSLNFEIDKDDPVLDSPDKPILDYSNEDDTVDSIVFKDKNIDRVEGTIKSYTVKDIEGRKFVESKPPEPFKFTDVKNGEIVVDLNGKMQEAGIYEVKTIAYDKAGNKSDEKIHTFVVLRNNDIIVGISESKDAYQFDGKGLKYDQIKDIEVDIYMRKDHPNKKDGSFEGYPFEVMIDGEQPDAKNPELVVIDDPKDCANGIVCYHFTLKSKYITTNYGENVLTTEKDAPFTVKEVDGESVTVGHIMIDNEKPKANYLGKLTDIPWYGGYYDNNNKNPLKIVIANVSDDVDIDNCIFSDNDTPIKYQEYDKKAKTITLELGEGEHDVSVTIKDYAGNEYSMDSIHVYVGSIFGRWWMKVLIALVIVILGVTIYFIVRIIRKRRK